MGGNSGLSFPSSEFDEFLFALVGEQQNGMPVSVFSALARLGIDPWREAKRLSDLPTEGAIGALRNALAGLADLHWAKIDTAGIAARLIRLLPSHGGLAQPRGASVATKSRQNSSSAPSSFLGAIGAQLLSVPAIVWLIAGAVILAMIYFAPLGDAPVSAPAFDAQPRLEQGPR